MAETETNVMEVVARGLTFQAPREVPSGWTTVRFRNESGMAHFALVERLPEGVGVQEQQAQVAPVFQEGLDLLLSGEAEAAMEKFGELPPWFGEIVFKGGPGLTAPGRTSQASVFLTPGTYLLECYVKTDGRFHSYNPSPDSLGMVWQFTVTDEASTASEPRATINVTLSGETGMEVQGQPAPGHQTFAVRFQDQTVHENFVGHDVHLARLTEDTDLDALAIWMDWSRAGGLETSAPVEFIGGINELPAGETGYFTVALTPGRYALVSEVTNPADKGMLRTFVVPGEGNSG
jgi:hypothetical protein